MNYSIKMLVTLLVMMFATTANAQSVRFSFDSGYNNKIVTKESVEGNIGNLLNVLHSAGTRNGMINLQDISMEPRAKTRLQALWDNCPFVCEYMSNVYSCLEDAEGYQVRGIPVIMKPNDNLYNGEKYRELVVSFNKRGVITGVSLALNNINAQKIMESGNAVKEMSERRMIMKFLEDFRCYYNEKDTAALRAVYSDDAIIIVGSVVTRRQVEGISANKQEIRYNKYNKEDYMKSLKRTFLNNKYINVEFDRIDVVKHPTREGFYGVTLHQKWDSSRYSDDGWLFLLWDFTDKEKPTIHVRTWQPWQVKELDVFTIDDFRLD